MDVNTLLNFVEELLNMYGYETRRNVGIVGGKIVTAPLEKETGKITERETIPKKEEAGIIYKADILAEKKDMERPFGRIVVRYKRGSSPVTPADVEHIGQLREHCDAHSALLVTVTGHNPDAAAAAIPLNVTIMTPEKVQQLLGKAMVKDKWWFNAPAYPIKWDYEKVKWKLKWFFEKMMFLNWDVIWIWNKELSYQPYWKVSYHVAPKKKGDVMKEGFFSINAYTGEIDTWWDIKPEQTVTSKASMKDAWLINEAIHIIELTHMVSRGKIQKPRLPKGVNFVIHRPSLEKHEAKLAAIQWISYVEGVDAEDVVVTGRELIYYPWWQFFYFYRPVIKNSWQDTEWFGIKMSAVYGDIFNAFKAYNYKRDVIYYYMEKSLIKLFGRDRYVKFMRKVTLGVTVLWWNYHLVLRPIYVWLLLLLITGGTIYAFMTATWGLSIIFGVLLVLIFMGPGYAFLYVLQDYLKRYPEPYYAHPVLTRKKWEREHKPIADAKLALDQLESMEAAGKLTKTEQKALVGIRKKQAKELLKKAKWKKHWWSK